MTANGADGLALDHDAEHAAEMKSLTREQIIHAILTAPWEWDTGPRHKWDPGSCYVCQQYGEYIELNDSSVGVAYIEHAAESLRQGECDGFTYICRECHDRLLPLPPGWDVM